VAFIRKRGKTYVLGWHEPVPFDPNKPPLTKAGTVSVTVKRALAAGRCYYSGVEWKDLGVGSEREALRLLADFESKNVKGKRQTCDDILFVDAVKRVLGAYVTRSGFQMRDAHTVGAFQKFFRGRYLSSITVVDLKRYEAEQVSINKTPSTIDRKLTVLRSLYRLFDEAALFNGVSPFKSFKLSNADAVDKPREITLEDTQQQALLRACFDPDLHAVYAECKEAVKREHADKTWLSQGLKHGRHYEYQEALWEAFKARGQWLAQLGYGGNEKALKRAFDHVHFQSQREATDCRVLRDLVVLELTYGLRRGELVGVPVKKDGEIIFEGGLKVGNWDGEKRTLTVMRTKQMSGSTKQSQWIVTPFIATLLDRHCEGRYPQELIFRGLGNNVHSFRNAFAEAVDFADIMVDTTNEEGMKTKVYPQLRDLRHVACCNMLDSGLSVDQVAKILGHTSTAMVSRVYGNRQKASTQQRQADMVAVGMERILGEQMTVR